MDERETRAFELEFLLLNHKKDGDTDIEYVRSINKSIREHRRMSRTYKRYKLSGIVL